MKTYEAIEIEDFLRAVDRHLDVTVRVIIIGGSAAALAHGASTTTQDIDTFESSSGALTTAIAAAVNETGLHIPMQDATVADVPYNSEDRLVRALPELRRLEVWVLEKHDLALSKIIRGFEHDFQQLREVHAAVGLDFETLVARFGSEMSHVNADPRRIRSQFIQLIDELFGETKAIAARRRLPEP